MGKPKPNLSGVLDNLPTAEPKQEAEQRKTKRPAAANEGGTVLVGANLPPRYAKNLALLSAETGRSKKELLQEALENLFVKMGGAGLR